MTEEENRFYTLTLKPSLSLYKGDMQELEKAYQQLLDIVGGLTIDKSIEKVGSDACHVHAMISCPYIKNKNMIKEYLLGYHYYLNIVRKNATQNVHEIWTQYIRKERNDSDRFTEVFGNMFPLEDLY